MADDLGMINSRYRLVSVTINERPFTLTGTFQSVFIPVVFMEAPSAMLGRFRTTAITMKEAPIDFAASTVSYRTSMVFSPPPANVYSVRQVAIITQNEQGTPTYMQQAFEQSLGQTDYLPAELVYSMLSDQQVVSHALQASDPMGWPKSYLHEGQTVEMAVHDTVAAMPSSMTEVVQVSQLELRSLVEEHIPVSMNYDYQFVEKVLLQSDPLPMYVGAAEQAVLAEKVLISRPPSGPVHSWTKELSIANLVLMKSNLPMYVGDTLSASSVMLALVDTSAEMPSSPSDALSVVSMALQGYEQETSVSTTEDASTAMCALIDASADYSENPIGVDNVASAATKVLIGADYPAPGGMSGINFLHDAEMVLMSKIEPMPLVSAEVGQAGLSWLLGTDYKTPEEMLPLTRLAISANSAHETLIARPLGNPISTMVAPSTTLSTVISKELLSPEQMLNTGLFSSTIVQQYLETAEYDSAKNASSTLSSDLVSESVLYPDGSFPDKSYSVSTLTSQAVYEAVVARDKTFPSKNSIHSALIVNAAYEVVAINDDAFPSKDAPTSFVNSSLIAAVAAFSADDYPSKNMVHSNLMAKLVGTVCAVSAAYPGKSDPQSALIPTLVGQVVMTKDTSLYGPTERVIRHRPNVSVTIVY